MLLRLVRMVVTSCDWRLASSPDSGAATGAGDGIADAMVPKARAAKVAILAKENMIGGEVRLKRSEARSVKLRGTWG